MRGCSVSDSVVTLRDGNRGTRPTSPQTVPRLAAKFAARPAPSAVPRFLSGVNTPTRSSVARLPSRPAPRGSANLDSAFGGMQLFAPEAWRAAPLLLTHSAQLTQPTVRLPQLSQRWARPHWPSVTCAAACVSDTARRLPAHCETMGVRSNHATSAWSHRPREVRSIYSVDDKTCLPAGAEQEGPAHNPLVNSPSTPRIVDQTRE